MIYTNLNRLVKISVQGRILHPGDKNDFLVNDEGKAAVVPSPGGICYNVKVGQPCMGLAGDHIEPGVSTANNHSEAAKKGYSTYSCIGNDAIVVTGDAKGHIGFVTGKHDLDRVLIHFSEHTLSLLNLNDEILIKAYGQGLELLDYPDIHVMNIDPRLLIRLGIVESSGKLILPVAKKIPAHLMGSGIGAGSVQRGDYDIMTQDQNAVQEHNLEDLRFGDIVLLEDCDNTYGRSYLAGSVTVGVISHGNCLRPGHGPGVTTILSCKKPLIEGVIYDRANIAALHPMTENSL